MIHIELIIITIALVFAPISIAFWIGYRKYRDIIRCFSSAFFSWFLAALTLVLVSKALEHIITGSSYTWKSIEAWVFLPVWFMLTIVISATLNRLFWGW